MNQRVIRFPEAHTVTIVMPPMKPRYIKGISKRPLVSDPRGNAAKAERFNELVEARRSRRCWRGSAYMCAKLGAALVFAVATSLLPLNVNAETVTILCFVPGLPPQIQTSDPERYNPSTIKFEFDVSNSVATAYNSKGIAVIRNMPLTSSDREFKFRFQHSDGSTTSWTLDRTTLQLGRIDSPNWTTPFELRSCQLFRKQL